MENMVELNERGESGGFFAEVRVLWDMYGSQFLVGARNTIIIALVSTVVGSIIGMLIAIYRSIPVNKKQNPLGYALYKFFDFFIVAYVEIFRGTPMMVQALIIYHGLRPVLVRNYSLILT